MSDNLKLWNAVKQPPAATLKTIGGGRLKGMTDIKPQWRYLAITEQFGPCGIGWKYTVEKLWVEGGGSGQIVAFANILLYIKQDGAWSEGIPGNGGSMFVAEESKGLHTSDEAYKMAITDALSTAMKLLGFAADVYMGGWDGSKFREEEKSVVKIDPEAKRQWAEQTRKALSNGDGAEARKLWDEWSTDEKVALWPALNSQERRTFKELTGDQT